MRAGRIGATVVGCGTIAAEYVATLAEYEEIEIRGVTDLDPRRSALLAGKYDLRCYDSIDDVLSDPAVELVINLTPPKAHGVVVERCLASGRHVYTEKPLALDRDEARALADLADQRGVRLACSPATFMGEAQQTAIKLLRDGAIGTVRVIYAEAHGGMIESWHPDPSPFYEIGPLLDLGPYALTIATSLFGPVRRVVGYGTVVKGERVADGTSFRVGAPDFVVLLAELASGPILRLTATFYVGHTSAQRGIEFHGDQGSVSLDSWERFDATVTHTPLDDEPRVVPHLRPPYRGTEWGRGALDLARAIRDGRPHRASARHAVHIVDVLLAGRQSYETGAPVEVSSGFDLPAPMEWAC